MGGSSTISTSEPMLGAVRVQQSTYGIALPVIFGRCRVSINLGWYSDFVAIPHTETTEQGGKGGGGVSQQNTTYTYQAAMLAFIGEGPIAGVRRIWQGKKQFDSLGQVNMDLATGEYGQSVWGHLATYHPAEAIGYSGIAYVRSSALALTQNAEVENHSLEVDGFLQYNGGPNCDPRDVVTAVLTNSNYGVGFPANRFADATDYSTYCRAAGLLISVALTEQVAARDMLGDLLRMTNTGPVWSGGKLKLIPYGDEEIRGNGVIYTPNLTPEYDLTHDEFLGDAEDPVKVRRKSPADRYNHVQIEFINSENGYNVETIDAKDQADIDATGLRTMPVVKMHALPTAEAAAYVAETLLQRSLYICNEYEFKLGWAYILLEGMDVVTLTDPRAKLDRTLVRIISVEEDPDGALTVIAEDLPIGTATAARYPRQSTSGYTPNYNATAGNVNVPVIFEPPDQLVNALEIWLAVSGLANYGGCNVWVSFDGETYKKVGAVSGPSRQGILTSALLQGGNVDEVNVLAVDLAQSKGQLLSGSQDDARNLRTLCYVDGELVAYETATLTGSSRYDLEYLVRGAYGTAIKDHAAGTQFARLDQAVFHYPFTQADIGRTIRIKFQAFNTFSAGIQELADLEPYTYTIKGSALNSPLPDVTNISSNFVSGITQIYWDGVSDFRSPIDYEVRIGPSWEAATIVGRTPVPKMPAVGDGQYWIAAHYRSPSGVDAYSALPQTIVLAGAILTQNVVAAHDEAATGWTGVLSGGASKFENTLRLMGAGNILASSNVLAEDDVLWLGGVAPNGIYEVPADHRINIGRVAPCNVLMTVEGYGQSIYDNFLALPNVLGVADLLGAALGTKVALQSQIRIAGADGIYGEWQNYVPGIYNAQHFEPRVVMSSFDSQVTAVMSGLRFAVDAPDRVDTGTNLALPAIGMTVTFASPFNGGHDGDPFPNVNAVILNAQQGDYLVISPATLTGFTVQAMNAGVGVSRNINWTAQGY